jgi:hypothetical protein
MPMFLLFFSIIAIFVDSPYSSMMCAKHPTNLALSLSITRTMDLHRITSNAKLYFIVKKDNLDGFFWYTLTALPHAHSINSCCLDVDYVIREHNGET